MAGNNYLPTEYQTFIHASRYARWLPDEGRRETWIETVTRLTNFFQIHLDKNLGVKLDSEVWRRIEDNIIGLNVMPSMRALMTAGSALERENIAGYNCSYIPIDNPKGITSFNTPVIPPIIANLPILVNCWTAEFPPITTESSTVT